MAKKVNGRNGGNGSSDPKLNGGNNSSNPQLKGIPVTEKTFYNDEELKEFEGIILKKLEKARNDLKLLTESYTISNEHDTTDTSPTFKVMEEGYQVLSKEENGKFAMRQEKFIKSLENALVRIKNKTYGICRVTHKLIPKDRLRVVPHATLSIEGKLILAEKNQQKRKPVGFYEKKVKVKMLA